MEAFKDVYIIDTSSLMHIQQLVSLDFFKPLFKSLEDLIKNGVLISSEDVLAELKGSDGSIYNWAKKQDNFFERKDEEIMTTARDIINKFERLADHGKPRCADPYIIALAIKKRKKQALIKFNCIVVTQEVSDKNKNPNGRQKIPDVCSHYGIKCIDLDQFLKNRLKLEISHIK